MVDAYLPDVGHVVWMTLDPRRGREQSGRSPVVILSPRVYNTKTSLAVSVPITPQRKGYPFEVALASTSVVKGVVLVDQVRSLNWTARNAEFADSVAPATLRQIRRLLATFLQLG